MSKTPTTIGPAGLHIIKQMESCRLRPYLCPANKLTIGWGHMLMPKWDAALFRIEPPTLRAVIDECQHLRFVTRYARQLSITQEVADKLLDRDANQTALFLSSTTRVPLNQHQFDALCSFIFNIGQGQYAESTLRKKLNAGDYAGAANEFERWIYGTVDGKKAVLPGLVARRQAERALFETPESS